MTVPHRSSGTRLTAGAAWHILLAAGLVTGAQSQAVPRADLPGRGVVRATFDPRIEWWDEDLVEGVALRLGAALTGDSVLAGPALPDVARLQTNIRSAGTNPSFVANLGVGRLSVLAQRRTTPLTLDVGLTGRLALGVTLPLVRTFVRSSFALDTTGGNLGLNPLITDPAAAGVYAAFFGDFTSALTNLETAIAGGGFGCPGSPQCAAAQAFLADARGVYTALTETVYGPGAGGGAPFLPLAGTSGAAAVDSNLARIQREFRDTYGDPSFARAFLFPPAAAPLDGAGFARAQSDGTLGYAMRPFGDTPIDERFWLGDIEVSARYGVVRTPVYAATVGVVWRLPTGHVASPDDPLALSAGDGQTDIEGQLVQELTLGGRLWLNLSLRGGLQRPGSRDRRLAPGPAFLVRPQARTTLSWDPGDYLAVDFAPLYRFHRWFAGGVTFGMFAKGEDRHTFAAAQDSIDLASRVGVPVSAAVLDAGTAQRATRVGIALSYIGPVLETGVAAERTVSGGSGRVPAAWRVRLVMRLQRQLF